MMAPKEHLIFEKYLEYCEYPTLSEAQLLKGIEDSVFSLHQLILEGKHLEKIAEKRRKKEEASNRRLNELFQSMTVDIDQQTSRVYRPSATVDREGHRSDISQDHFIIVDDIHSTSEGTVSPWLEMVPTSSYISPNIFPVWEEIEPRGPHHYHKYLSYIRDQEIENPAEIRRIKYEKELFKINMRSAFIRCRIRDPTFIDNNLCTQT